MQKFGDLVNIKTGRLDANAADVDGIYPFFTCAVKPLKINTFAYDCECSLVAGNGDLNVKYYKGKFNAYQRVYIIESKDKSILDTKYQTIFLDTCLRSLRNKTKGAVIQFIRLGDLTGLKLFLPSLEDQLHIANLLSKAETLISQRKESIRLLDQYLKSTFLEMFGPNFYTEKRWKIEPFGNFILTLTDYHANGSYESLREIVTLKKEPDFALMVRTTDLENNNFTNNCNYIDERAYNFLEKSKVFGGEIIINKIGSAGKVYLMPFLKKPVSLGMNAFLLRFDNRLNNLFTFFLLSSSFGENEIQKNVKGAVTKTITKDAIRGIRIPIPPISLQTQFGQIVEKTEALKTQYQQSLQELEQLYGSLSQKAFRGELTIKENFLSQAAEPSMEYKKSEKF